MKSENFGPLTVSLAAHGVLVALIWYSVGEPLPIMIPGNLIGITVAPKLPMQSAGNRALRPNASPISSHDLVHESQLTDPTNQNPTLTTAEPVAVAQDASELLQIRSRVSANLAYPMALRRRGVAGQLVVEWVVAETGALESLSLPQPSGSAELDQLALDAVKKAAPFPELKGSGKRKLRIPLQFRLR